MKGDVILLVEDNDKIMAANRRMLELNGYVAKTAASIEEAGRRIADGAPNLVVLDIMLPDGSGLDFCRSLRETSPDLPVLFLTVLNENSDIVAGLRAGGDDYLTKPYDYDVLLARVEALLRRTRRMVRSDSNKRIGRFTIDRTAQRVYLDGRDMLLKPREYALFRLFAGNPGVYFQPEDLYRKVWAINPTGDLRTVYAHISGLRKKLGLGDDASLAIELKRGKGYRLTVNEGPDGQGGRPART